MRQAEIEASQSSDQKYYDANGVEWSMGNRGSADDRASRYERIEKDRNALLERALGDEEVRDNLIGDVNRLTKQADELRDALALLMNECEHGVPLPEMQAWIVEEVRRVLKEASDE